MPCDSVVTIPVETTPASSESGSIGPVLLACSCCLLLGYSLGSSSSEVSFFTAPSQRIAVNSVQPGLSVSQGRSALAQPQIYSLAVPQAGITTDSSSSTATSTRGTWTALSFAVPALAALYAVSTRFGRSTSQPYPTYGTATQLNAVPEGSAAEEVVDDSQAYPENAEAGEDYGDEEYFDDEEEEEGVKGRGRGKGKGKGKGKGGKGGGKGKGKGDDLKETVVQVRRVTKVVKGGKQLKFRAVVIVGDGKGKVGVGCASHKEVMGAVTKAAEEARDGMITVHLNKTGTFPHPATVEMGACKVYMSPACDGTGVIAGGAVRVVMEAAGVQNCLAKQQGSGNPLGNARCTIRGLSQMRTLREIAKDRNKDLSEMFY